MANFYSVSTVSAQKQVNLKSKETVKLLKVRNQHTFSAKHETDDY